MGHTSHVARWIDAAALDACWRKLQKMALPSRTKSPWPTRRTVSLSGRGEEWPAASDQDFAFWCCEAYSCYLTENGPRPSGTSSSRPSSLAGGTFSRFSLLSRCREFGSCLQRRINS